MQQKSTRRRNYEEITIPPANPVDITGYMAQQQLTVGNVTMTINPEKGARILSFQYKGQEMISQLKAPESFGSTFWTSPQKEWNWPPVREFDKMPYQVEEHDGSLIMTSEVSRRLKYRVSKEFTTDKKDNAIVVTHSIINLMVLYGTSLTRLPKIARSMQTARAGMPIATTACYC